MLRLALINCPTDTTHYSRIASRIRHGRFVAVVDRDPELAKSTADALGVPFWTTDFASLLGRDFAAVDAAVIHADENGTGLEICEAVALAGKHILLESPVSLSPKAATGLVAMCKNAGVRLMVGPSLRFMPSVQTIKQSLDSGRLGTPAFLRIHLWAPVDSLRKDKLLGQLAREIDLASWIYGQPPVTIYATGRQVNDSDRDALDYIQVHLGFSQGGMALVDYAQALPLGDSYFSLTLIGSSGAAYADDHHDKQLVFGGGHPQALSVGQSDGQAFFQLQEFVMAIVENRPPSITGDDYMQAIQIAETAVASSLARQPLGRTDSGYVTVEVQ